MKKMLALILCLCLLTNASFAERLLVTSDWHLTEDEAAFSPMLQALGRALAGDDILLVLGDNTNNSHVEEHHFVKSSLEALQKTTGHEVYVIPGNHDFSGAFRAEDFVTLYEDFGWKQAFSRDTDSASYAVMTGGGVCLLMMDTNTWGAGHALPGGGESEETLAWVKSTLASLPEDTRVIACGHHPILPEGRGHDGLAGVLTQAGVTLYLCGHDHGFGAVRAGTLQQITVGQSQAYPGYAGHISLSDAGFTWETLSLYAEDDPWFSAIRAQSQALALQMGSGTLRGTVHEGDEEAIDWFVRCFALIQTGSLTEETCASLLREEGARKWSEIETSTVVKGWLFGILNNCPQDVRHIEQPWN
ncbi:MAG: metallophosphoesterase [Clostridia bacterium]|nr:metallophosphoesterase [Clostridia bacterium]